ncbi:MAG: formate dehydrogenase accessory sulfurtransferase FdhD [Desulfobacterales bacterium]|nr:formate dehydrogenase accessory sulfurtransferase FdhD [Desulfobacterales bacterium]
MDASDRMPDVQSRPATTHNIQVLDHTGRLSEVPVVGEYPLTITLNGTEVVTLMTLAAHPEDLVLGYLRNQRLISRYADILSVKEDWEHDTVHVKAKNHNLADMKQQMKRKVVTTGCGEGTVFSCSLDKIYDRPLSPFRIRQSDIYGLGKELLTRSDIYKAAGSVHTCALCTPEKVIYHVEDVGRHNAADTISGKMWAADMDGGDTLLYSTGRVTSEIVIKCASMGIPIILSRSGITRMGYDIARDLNMVVIGRAKARKFMVYCGHSQVILDAVSS